MEDALATPAGCTLRFAQQTLQDLDLRFHVTLDDLSCEDYRALLILKQESARHDREGDTSGASAGGATHES